MNPAIFYPDRGEDLARARAICAECPVTAECMAAGATEFYGVWAGTSMKERQRARNRRRPPCGTLSGFRYHQMLGEHCAVCTRVHNEVELHRSAS